MTDGRCLPPPPGNVQSLVRLCLEEDLPWGDVTSETLVPAEIQAAGRFVAKEDGVICGLGVAALVFEELDSSLHFAGCLSDGARARTGEVVAEVRGAARSILSGERTALNLLQRMSGIATATARYVEAVEGTPAHIVDTRKTCPGLRLLDKYAVRCGGGANHRFSLSDGALVKDNHLAAIGAGSEEGLASALLAMRRSVPHTLKIEVEVDRLDQVEPALAGGADIILLDNMGPEELRRAVGLIGGRALTEASGGITLENVREIAQTGVDLISVGALTHSVRALDISLELSPTV
jgi:nicotinate-nucleotide pyrophosphorylase (carboxylating)